MLSIDCVHRGPEGRTDYTLTGTLQEVRASRHELQGLYPRDTYRHVEVLDSAGADGVYQLRVELTRRARPTLDTSATEGRSWITRESATGVTSWT